MNVLLYERWLVLKVWYTAGWLAGRPNAFAIPQTHIAYACQSKIKGKTCLVHEFIERRIMQIILYWALTSDRVKSDAVNHICIYTPLSFFWLFIQIQKKCHPKKARKMSSQNSQKYVIPKGSDTWHPKKVKCISFQKGRIIVTLKRPDICHPKKATFLSLQ